MEQQLVIRPECEGDIDTIESIIIEAFIEHPHSDNTEHHLVARLRETNALTISLVAEINNVVVGHIAFSKVNINNEFIGWYGLAPVSVKPDYQHQGVGSHLILSGINAMRDIGAKGCVLLGEPEYYNRFGFKTCNDIEFKGVPPEYFQSLLLMGDMPSGNIEYHHAFK